jgi:hypothetical protein
VPSRRRKHARSSDDPSQRRFKVFSAPRAGRLSRQVAIALGTGGRLGRSAKDVAAALRVPLRTTYRTLGRLESVGVAKRVPGGFALSSVVGDITTDPTALLAFENIEWRVSKWQTDPTPPCRTAKPWTRTERGDAGPTESVELAWEGRRVSLCFYPSSGALTVKIGAHTPIPLEQAPVLQGWLTAMLGLGRGEESECTHLEVNATHESFRADGFRYLEIRRLGEFAHVLYQKTAGLKHEIRLYRPLDGDGEKVSVERSLEILAEGSPLRVLLRIVERELELERLKVTQTEPERTAQRRQSPDAVAPSMAREEGVG